ncbi:MAG TPA: TolC family protein [Chthoniobacteraceae bacterium]|nr:TolC family protein [Chthoniobacteraceae bacterium]
MAANENDDTEVLDPAATGAKKAITLEQAYAMTLATDQSVRNAYLEIRKDNLLPWSALTKLSPRLTAGYSANHSETKTLPQFENPSVLTATGSQNANYTLQQTLIDFTFFPAYRLAKLQGASARLQYQFTLRTVLFGVAKAYYEVLKQQKIVKLDSDNLTLAGNQLQLSENQHQAGAVSRVDVLRAQSTLETARQTLITDRNTLLLDRDNLANMLNLPVDDRNFSVSQPDDAAETGKSFEASLAQAYANREDFKVSSLAISENQEQRNEVIGEYAPSVSANFSQNWAASTGNPNSESWGASISVNVPIFTGGQREIDLRTAHYNIEEAKLALETTAKNVEADVRTTWLEVETLRQTIKSLKAQVAADEQNYQDLLNQYKVGAATSLDTQTALFQLFTSRTNLVEQTYQFQVALRDLQRSISAFQDDRVKGVRLPKTVFEPTPKIYEVQ